MDVPAARLDASGPFDFSLSVGGDLQLCFRMAGLPMALQVPAGELRKLQHFLEASETTRATLAAERPEKGPH